MTIRVIAYTFALWSLTSIILGLILGSVMARHAPKTPNWPWEGK